MDASERARYKQLANDSIIATFGRDTNEARLAQALERCVDDLDYIATECDQCKYCNVHGEVEDDTIAADAAEVLQIHKRLKSQLEEFKKFHIRLSGEVALSDRANPVSTELPDALAEIIEETESYVNELEAEVLP